MKKYTREQAEIIARRMANKAVEDGEKNDREYKYPYAVGALTSMISTILQGGDYYCDQFLEQKDELSDKL